MIQPMRIIILDDDPTFCYLIKREFRKIDIKVVVCDEVGDFAEKIKNSKFDLAVIDYSLDGLNGLQVAQCVPGLKVLIISRTANWVENKKANWSKNVVGFLHKKYGPKVMAAEILRHWRLSISEKKEVA